METMFKTDKCDWLKLKEKVYDQFAENNEKYKTNILDTIEKCLIEAAYKIIPQCKMLINAKLNIWWNEKIQKAKKERQNARRKQK